MGTGDSFRGVKRQGREADHSPPSSAEVKNGGALPSFTYIYSWRNALLIKHKGNFTFIVDFCEDYCLLRCDAVQSGRNLLTFGRNVLPCLQSRYVCRVNDQ
jgi:hypothetical protein